MRPTKLSEIIGQPDAKTRLSISIQAAKMQNKPLGHILIDGPPGLGKTTLANVIAEEMEAPLVAANGTTLDGANAIMDALLNVPYGAILYIDEIHALPKAIQENLYTVMEDFQLVDSGLYGLQIQPFTLVGTTTHVGKLNPPFLDRFKTRFTIEYYEPEDLATIVKPAYSMDDDAAMAIGRRSRGTPRIALRYAEWVRDYCLVNGLRLTLENVQPALDAIGVDDRGLTNQDRHYMEVLGRQFRGGPAGLAAIAASMNTATETLESEIEPFLLRLGLIVRTARGRRINQFMGRAS